MSEHRTARDELVDWVNRRRRGGFTEAETFTLDEVGDAMPGWSRSQVWRVASALVREGRLRTRRSTEDGRVLTYAPTGRWGK